MQVFAATALRETSVELAVSCAFTASHHRNIIVARASLLQVFAIGANETAQKSNANSTNTNGHGANSDSMESDTDYILNSNSNANIGSECLTLAHEFRLMGVVASLAVVRLPGRVSDSLLLAFADAKMSLVDFSPAVANLVTVSIHYFERDEIKRELTFEKSPPELRVDPQSRCAALSFYGDRMAILPFRQDVSADPDDPSSKYPFHPSHVFKVSDIDPKVRRIVDFAFLHDFFEPTLAILYETYQTWAGRLAARCDTRNLLVVSLDLTKRTFPILYQSSHLPYNATTLYPLTSPLGGVLIKSVNALIYVDQTSLPGVAVAFNNFYGREHILPAPPPADSQGPTPKPTDNLLYHKSNVTDYKGWGINLLGAELEFVNPDTCVVVCAGGEVIAVELIGHDDAGAGWKRKTGGVKRFRATRLGVRATVPKCILRIAAAGFGNTGNSVVGGIKRHFDDENGVSKMLLFVASRVSESLLISVMEFPGGEFGIDGSVTVSYGENSSGAKNGNVRNNNDNDNEDDDEDEDLYGDSASKKIAASNANRNGVEIDGQKPPRFILQVCDALPGLGPIRDMAVGEPAKYSEDDFAPGEGVLRRDLEAVCCVGQGSYGALGVLSRNVRPKILTTVELNEIKEVWSVKCFDPNSNAADNEFHKFLVMSKEFGTTVLQTGEELQEISDSGFYTAGPTVFAASVLKDTAIMQVQPNGVLLVDYEGKLIQNLEIGDDNTWIVSCSVSDEYVVLLLNVGDLILLKSNEETRHMAICYEKKDAAITSASLYCSPAGSSNFLNVGSILNAKPESGNLSPINNKRKRDVIEVEEVENNDNDDEDDDDDLYGESSKSKKKSEINNRAEKNSSEKNENGKTNYEGVESLHDKYYCFAYKEDGTLDVLMLPDFTVVFHVPRFDNVANIINDSFASGGEDEDNFSQEVGADINEILVVSLGPTKSSQDVYLMARTETGDLIIYRVILQEESYQSSNRQVTAAKVATKPAGLIISPPSHRLAISLVRVPHNHISREPVAYSDGDEDKLKPLPKGPVRPSFVKRHYLRPFSRIGGSGDAEAGGASSYCGVFMTGKKPCWVMVSQGGSQIAGGLESIEGAKIVRGCKIADSGRANGKGFLRVHPCVVDGSVKTFAELHNVNVQHGFVYINDMGLLRLCQLPWQFNYDLEWPMCKIPLRRAPHKISYHFESQTYVMAASTPFPFNLSKAQQAAALAAGVLEQGEELEIVGEKAKEDRTGLYYASSGAYSLELISPVTWETVDRFALEEYEQVLCCQVVSLDSKQTTSGRKLFLAVGTGMCRGEDLTARGRILIFDIIDVVPEIDNPQTCHKFKLLHTVDERSPITALCGINGYLLCAIGSRMIIHAFEDSDNLNGIAFLDTNIYVNNLTAIKNTIILSDEDPPKLRMLGKDYTSMLTYACEYVIENDTMAFLVSDHEKNIHVLSYMPECEMHMGSRIQKFVRLRKLPIGKTKFGAIAYSKQHFCVGCTLDGSLNYTIPVSEKLYKRLYAVYSRMVNNLQPLAGLNPRGFRQIQTRHKPLTTLITAGPPGPKSVLDGDFIMNFFAMSVSMQRDIARGVGSSVERIIDDILEVYTGTDYF
ncbi:Cleavage and polyadenylation specificity factor subunit 1 [Physocladia obscura]|uniref:Cleavage and polyadenylation specificity factor subunit 1 n=1 Tax=Physocladia obscura TaxID=109957 RepID=A0AAD5TA77_9FUNG|nr:Cleavage and polyadenylation specificity factor subunit 1 [Physocladia obscura]